MILTTRYQKYYKNGLLQTMVKELNGVFTCACFIFMALFSLYIDTVAYENRYTLKYYW